MKGDLVRDHRAVRLSVWLYRRLARAFPYEFRRRFGDDLSEAFQDHCRQAWRSARWLGLAGLWARTLGDLLTQGVCERAASLRPVARSWKKGNAMSSLSGEIRFTMRSLSRSPVFSGVVVLTLAAAIGANTALFSMISPFLFRPLPFPDSRQLVHLFETDLGRKGELGWDMVRQSAPTFLDWKGELGSFQGLEAYYYESANLADSSEAPAQLTVGRVTSGLFPLLGAEPLRGRSFEKGEEGRVAVVDHGLWQSRYGGSDDVIGSEIRLDGAAYTVVGVMPADFNFPFGEVRMWTPLVESDLSDDRERRYLLTVGRLKPGVGIESASQELKALHRALAEAHPGAYGESGARIVPLRQALIFFYDQFQALAAVLMFAVALVLLIVCANVSNLMIARASRRTREVAIRRALGAGKARLAAQAFMESFILAAAAAALGAALAYWCVAAVGTLIPAQLFRVGEIRVDAWALVYTLATALGAALLFGIAPALRIARTNLRASLEESSRSTQSPGGRRLTRILVAAQTAGAMLLCAGAFLAIDTMRELKNVELGFDPQGVASVSLNLPSSSYATFEEVRGFHDSLLERIEALPGVSRAALARTVPLNFEEHSIEYSQPGEEESRQRPRSAMLSRVSPGYFKVMRVPLLTGRGFGRRDGSGSLEAVVSASLAKRLWPGRSPLEETLVLHARDEPEEAIVVGVAADAVGGIAFMDQRERIYLPLRRAPSRTAFLLARSRSGDASALAPVLREQVWSLDPDLPLGSFSTMEDLAYQASRPLQVAAGMLSGFAGFALLLAALGIYGLVSYAASLLGPEIAIRMAMGAGRRHVLRLMLRRSLGVAVVGMAVGGLLTLALHYAAAALDESAAPGTIPVLAVVALIMFAAASLAALPPIRRALRTDPMQALRAE